MNDIKRCELVLWLAGLVFVLAMLGGCAPAVVRHSFSFDAFEEPGVELLDYKYGDSRQPGAQADKTELRDGKVRQSAGVTGDILRPETLYVKWRLASTGEVFEDSVDLARLLPRDIAGHRIHFTVKGRQLFVYLITPKMRSDDDPAIGPLPYQVRKTIILSSTFGRRVKST